MRRFCAVVIVMLALLGRRAAGAEPEKTPQFGETMTVVRYLVEARVTDAAGRAVTDIPASEFSVTIGKARAYVEAADWNGSTRPTPAGVEASATGEPASGDARPANSAVGRNVVFFVQTDFGRDSGRILGQMAFMANLADKVVGMLQPEDRIAVVSFDSHLKLRCDFTTDREAALEAIRGAIAIDKPAPPVVPSSGPSLLAGIDAKAAKKASRAETALLLVARALRPIEGERLMFLVGWGFGDMIWGKGVGGSRLVLPRAWSDAVGLLHRDHVPVITIGTGSGQLTLGVALTARATGGLHTSALASFPEQTLTRIEGALDGYYELVLRMDEPLTPGEYPIVIRTKDPRYRVLSAPVIVIEKIDTRYADAIELINAGEVDAGVQALRESMAMTQIPADVLVERLTSFVDAAQWDAALAVVERLEAEGVLDDDVARMKDEAVRGAATRKSAGVRALLVEAQRKLLDGDSAKALVFLDRAIAVDPRFAEAWYERGMLLLSLGRTSDAGANLKRYLELNPAGANAATAREVLAGIERR
ncbi:MAG: tetratricopeptide repeat protein [Thermoanaerobaculia bacterium]